MPHDQHTRRAATLLLGDTRLVGHHGSSSVVRVILDQLAGRDINVVSSIARPDLLRDLSRLKSNGITSIIINGEGAFHGRSENALRFAGIAKAASALAIPCFILNSVFDECEEEVMAGLRLATTMFCREGLSKARADANGVPAQYCPDLTFALPDFDTQAWTPGSRIIVTDSTLAGTNRALHGFARRHGLEFLPLRGRPEIISYRSKTAVTRAFKHQLRHTVGRLFPGRFQSDRYGCALPTIERFVEALTDRTALVISGRFHGVCFCLKLGVPFLAVRSNTYKVEGLLEDAGMTDRLISLDQFGEGSSTREALLDAGKWSDALETQRSTYLASTVAPIARCFDQVAAATVAAINIAPAGV